MAHQIPSRTTIDEAARAASSQIETADIAEQEIALAYGAEGPAVTKLVDLLALLGFATNDVIAGRSTMLDETVLVDIRAAKDQLAIAPFGTTTPIAATELAAGVQGELVDQAVWDRLYEAAANKLQDTPAGADPGEGSQDTPQA
jgi:hypothetical protein